MTWINRCPQQTSKYYRCVLAVGHDGDCKEYSDRGISVYPRPMTRDEEVQHRLAAKATKETS